MTVSWVSADWMRSIDVRGIGQMYRRAYGGEFTLKESWWDERVLPEDCNIGVSHCFLLGLSGLYFSCPHSSQYPYPCRQ